MVITNLSLSLSLTLFRRNIESLNALLDHLILIDREQQVVEFIVEHADLQLVERRNVKRFYSKLLRKLIENGLASETIQLLKHCLAKEAGALDEDLVALVNKSSLKEKDKWVCNEDCSLKQFF